MKENPDRKKYIIKEKERIQEHFLWKNSRPKSKHKTLRMDSKNW